MEDYLVRGQPEQVIFLSDFIMDLNIFLFLCFGGNIMYLLKESRITNIAFCKLS